MTQTGCIQHGDRDANRLRDPAAGPGGALGCTKHHPLSIPSALQLDHGQSSSIGGAGCLPSVRMVKGESPRRLAENCPPRDVIKKHRVKNPMPSTNILQEGKQRCKEACRVPQDIPTTRGSTGQPLSTHMNCFAWGHVAEVARAAPAHSSSLGKEHPCCPCSAKAAPCLPPQPEPRTRNESPTMLLPEAWQQTGGFSPNPPSKITVTCSDGQA